MTRRGRIPRAALGACLLLLAAVAGADDERVELLGERQRLVIATTGGLPLAWESCDEACASPGARRQVFAGPGEGGFAWVDAAGPAGAPAALRYRAEISTTAGSVVALLTAVEPLSGRTLTQRYEISRRTHEANVRWQAPAGVAVEQTTGPRLVPEPLPGFGAAFSDVEAVRVSGRGQERLDAGAPAEAATGEAAWYGGRARFWAWLARPGAGGGALVVESAADRIRLRWPVGEEGSALAVYAGPVEWKSLRVVAPELTQMLFASLWEPLRWLCFGLLALLGLITRWIADPGIAIILLSLAVKFILYPLTRIADRWQQDVNRIQGRLQPKLDAIKREFRGEEAHRRTLATYREEGVHPLFTLKSLAGFAIQVPMFIAAFDMLADNYALSGARFLWVDDLAAPDRLARLPFALPFFGAYFNLLPLLMTALTVLSAITQKDESLTPALLEKQQRQLYLMAGGFFLLFYTFPAGMVLYWTANNFWHFVKMQLSGTRRSSWI